MMNRIDLGGCCLARYGTAAPYFASKTDQIMSRYRPIAPKPAAQSAGGVVEKVGMQQAPGESGKVRTCNRSRKRSFDAINGGFAVSASPRGQKRAARARCHVSEALDHNNPASVPISSVCHSHSHSYSHSHGHCPQSDTSEEGISTLCEISDSAGTNTGAVSLNFGLRPLAYSCINFEALKNKEAEVPPPEKDAAFMERAAASASPAVNLQGLISSEMRGRALDQPPFPLHRQKEDFVTLPLLPNCKASSTTSSTESGVIQSPLEDEELSLCEKTTLRSRCLDISAVDQLYFACSDPLILTDNSHSRRVIWYNPAYHWLLSLSASDLGTFKPLAAFNLDGKFSTGILWGLGSKFSSTDQPREAANSRVIMPQPLRPVGSSVVVECITDTHLQEEMNTASMMSMEEVEEQLESKTSPCLISDSQKTVRWSNSAYRQMVGQPECSWLEKESNKVVRIQGKILLLFNLQLPQNVSAFSCRVKIQWNNAGDKTSITVPCDVFRFNGNGHSLAWHFDIQAALCL